MISYFEEFLGMDSGTLLSSDAGVMISVVVSGVLIFAAFKVVHYWLDNLFNRY